MNAQEVPGVYKLVKGKSYKYLIEIKVNENREAMGQTINITVDGTITNKINIVDILPSGNFLCQNLIENALIMIETPQGPQIIGKELSGKSFLTEMTPTGDVIERDTISKIFTPENAQIVSTIKEVFPNLNGTTLTIGSSWTKEKSDTTSSMGSIIENSKTIYTVKEKKMVDNNECLSIEVTGTNENSGTITQGGNDIHISGEGNAKGTFLFVINEGLFTLMQVDHHLEQTITIPSQGNMRIPSTRDKNIKVELVK